MSTTPKTVSFKENQEEALASIKAFENFFNSNVSQAKILSEKINKLLTYKKYLEDLAQKNSELSTEISKLKFQYKHTHCFEIRILLNIISLIFCFRIYKNKKISCVRSNPIVNEISKNFKDNHNVLSFILEQMHKNNNKHKASLQYLKTQYEKKTYDTTYMVKIMETTKMQNALINQELEKTEKKQKDWDEKIESFEKSNITHKKIILRLKEDIKFAEKSIILICAFSLFKKKC